jgi:ABC-type branched-subunit amino acid transport system ATPase component
MICSSLNRFRFILAPCGSRHFIGQDSLWKLSSFRGSGQLIVEQKVREVLEVCHSVCCLKLGKVTYSGPPQELKSNPDKLRQVFL